MNKLHLGAEGREKTDGKRMIPPAGASQTQGAAPLSARKTGGKRKVLELEQEREWDKVRV